MYNQPKYTFLLLVLLMFFIPVLHAQKSYWQQQVNYKINVALNDVDNTLDADETITYTNNSPDTLHFIWFHLWPNAYKNDKTEFSEQLLRNNNTSFYFSDEKERGYINHLSFKVDDVTALLEPDSSHIDVVKLLLPRALPPQQSTTITTPYHIKLPFNFSRSGYEGQTYQVAQWYPKPAVYDANGWHQMPYLDQGEFYSEFGNFDVTITVPENYIVASSGNLQNEDELNKLKELGKQSAKSQNNYKLWQSSLLLKTIKLKKNFDEVMPPSKSAAKTLRYQLQNAHDFAWFASKLFIVKYDSIKLATHNVDAFTYYNPWDAKAWDSSMQYVKDAVHFYSKKLGEYPYDVVSAVSGRSSKDVGGMEYPTITLLEMADGGKELDATITHEVGHNWLYGILASNERYHAWMDEGINTYYEKRYLLEKYGELPAAKQPKKRPLDEEDLIIRSLAKIYKDQPADLPANDFTELNYGMSAYTKGAQFLLQLEAQTGTALFDSSMHHYYNEWKYKHPQPQDFKQSFEAASGVSITDKFKKLFVAGTLKPEAKKQLKLTAIYNIKETDKYRYISIAPLAGFNYYDKLMIGGIIHNYQLPLNKFNFLVAPLYATGSSQLNGTARLSYSIFSKRKWLEFSASGSKFNKDVFTQFDNSRLYLGVTRIVPSIKYTLYNKDIRSTQRWTFKLRTFILNEENLNSFTQVETPTDTFFVAGKKAKTTNVTELKIGVSNNRKLYPYDADLTINQGKSFVRAGFTGKYFFNYKDEDKGVQARFFAGKFFYTQEKTLLSKGANQRYLLSLAGPSGTDDYTYSDYFVGRSESDGGLSQQIMQRDGFFKVNTPFRGENAVGKTDNWLLSLNLVADIPKEINPLNVLPFKVPVQLFADIGTYSDVWDDDNANGRFLFDAGLKISILHSAFNVYLPLIYSKVYRDYYKTIYPEKRFSHTISFSFDLQQLAPNKLNRSIPL